MGGKIKKVMVELANGEVIEFNKQAILFLEDEMTDTEKKVHGSSTKMCNIANCDGQFMANAAQHLLATIRENAPGLDSAIMMRHIEGEESNGLFGMLAEIFG